MPGGRPTDYTPEIVQKARDYVDGEWKELSHKIPSVARLAIHLNLNRSTIYDWSSQEEKKEFSNILDDLLAIQEFTLVDNGLDGSFNPSIAKLVLGKHGYHEKQDHQHSGEGGGPIKTKFTVEIIQIGRASCRERV